MNSIKDFLGRYKKSAVAVLTLVVLFVVASFAIASYETWWKPYREKQALEAWQAKLEKPYREDVYGGATPEETWGLFLNALRNGDIDLASKYFVVEKQGSWKKTIINTKEAGKLDKVIKNISVPLQKEKNYLQGEKAYFYYELRDEKTKEIYNNSVVFYFNPYTKIWKILVL